MHESSGVTGVQRGHSILRQPQLWSGRMEDITRLKNIRAASYLGALGRELSREKMLWPEGICGPKGSLKQSIRNPRAEQ
jgi:hypothetical protein